MISKSVGSLKVPRSEVNKTSKALLEALLTDTKKEYRVDLFISDEIDERAVLQDIGAKMTSSATFVRDLDTNKTTYMLNTQVSDDDDFEKDLSRHNSMMDYMRKLKRDKRSEAIAKIASMLDKTKELSKAIESAPSYLTLTLTKKELLGLMSKTKGEISDYDFYAEFKPSSALSDWITRRDGYLRGVSISQMHGSWSGYFPNTYGQGVGIYYSDMACPSGAITPFNNPVIYAGAYENPYEYTVVNPVPTERGYRYHARMITGILSTVANSASLYCNTIQLGDDDTSDEIYYQNITPTSAMFNNIAGGIGAINLESYSLNRYKSNSKNAIKRPYTAMDALFDRHTFTNYTRPVFISAANYNETFNPNLHIVSPAKAFNVTTVGSYKRDGIADQKHSDLSAFVDPTVGGSSIRKPEVSAPGEKFYCENLWNNDRCGGADNNFEVSGTSFSTPWVAAMAANVMSQGNYWKSSAAMMKAVVIAGATDTVSVASGNMRDKVGEGGVDLFTMTWQLTNSAYWRDWSPTRPFATNYGTPYDNGYCFTNWQVNLYANRSHRLVISWLNDVNSAGISQIPNSYKMELLRSNGTVAATANESNQGYQIINTNQPAGTYRVRVCKNRQDNKRFDMGFAVSQRFEGSTWQQ